jgi:hypothetical protein
LREIRKSVFINPCDKGRCKKTVKHDAANADNLFSRLFSYTPRVGREPLEDYCTEALAWCLRNSLAFRDRFLNLLEIPEVDNYTSLKIDTQFSFKPETDNETVVGDNNTADQNKQGGRFDMVIQPCAGPKFVIVFEMKVSAKFGKNQLKKYRQELQKGELFGVFQSWIVTLTNATGKDPKADRHIRWSEVQELLLLEPSDIICKSFAAFLGENGMKRIIIPKTTSAQLPERMNGILLFEKLKEFLESFRNQREELKKCFKKDAVLDRDPAGKVYLGIYARKAPYIYFGIRLTNEKNDPDFCLYVDANTREPNVEGKVSPRFKDCLKVWEDQKGFSIESKPIVENFDGGNSDIMSEWLDSAITEAQKFARY